MESPPRAQGKLWWVHSASTATLTAHTVHPKRVEKAMGATGILPALSGVAIHDSWASYWTSPCGNGLRHVHHLRAHDAVVPA